MKRLASALVIHFCLISFPCVTYAQHTPGRWALGIHSDGNAWITDYDQRIVGLGGDVQARYGVSPLFSAGFEIGMARFKTGLSVPRPDIPRDYLALSSTSFSLLCWLHFLPGKALTPYMFSGIGFMHYVLVDGIGTRIPGSRMSVRIPLGCGIEAFSQKRMSFDFNIAYILFDDKTDILRRGSPDGAFNAGFGMNFYIGSSDDDDDDGDGLTNAEEANLGTNPTNPDTDEDGLSDGEEVKQYHTDPLNADTDGDKLRDGEEVHKYFTNPLNPDTDGDGVSDYDEVLHGTDPLDPASH